MKKLLAIGAVALLAIGCVGDPDVDPGADPDPPDLALDETAERDEWEAAEPGCEDVASAGLRLVKCEGAPTLGCLVDDTGEVACVDGLALLLEEIVHVDVDPRASDPSPQPSHPGVAANREALGVRPDPTPTPIVRAERPDPTPTPMTQADDGGEQDPTPTPMVEPRR